ncbi:hypothetical protein P4133_15670 [Pseudomonas aeruginosa]|nr:hypothetical protein [Pseudomonas aeruginosa]
MPRCGTLLHRGNSHERRTQCLGASRRALCGLAARLLAKAAHLLMVISVRAYASGRLSQVEVKYLLDCSSALNRASLRLAMGQ